MIGMKQILDRPQPVWVNTCDHSLWFFTSKSETSTNEDQSELDNSDYSDDERVMQGPKLMRNQMTEVPTDLQH
jgi:hypothetical protein